MKDDTNGRQPKWMTTQMEDDLDYVGGGGHYMEKSKSGLSTRWKLLVQMEQSWPLFLLTFLVLAPSVEAKLAIVFTDFFSFLFWSRKLVCYIYSGGWKRSWRLFSPFYFFWSWRFPWLHSLPLFSLTFGPSFWFRRQILTILITDFWSRRLAAPPMVTDGSKADHCFCQTPPSLK